MLELDSGMPDRPQPNGLAKFLVRSAVGAGQDALEAVQCAVGVANLNINELIRQGYVIADLRVDTQTIFLPDAVLGYSPKWTHIITQTVTVICS